ncbi:DctP family TRAP transporter solute-binding subunit [Paenibacillus chitinolyticus]|uniref:DctP family TRAP transporter solute-binding subunit n=1 Tax=Paenibacillus chitinolyticus TaxID=79263 RepID=UPI002DB5C2BF|nr:DctP family TRAP transporter solute-binding subunit [Paenibacillus chitinolyticus]MEC0248404.1 DctP family TRAP transporter solute-binding subunit [Paenibacillus chitinolyticus]
MKPAVIISLFVLLGLCAAVIIGFRPSLSSPLPHDDEQSGLKERITIKFSHVVAENTPKGLAAEHFANLVAQKSQDRIEIQVFPNGMLYSDPTEVDALKRGDIQMIAPAYSKLSAEAPAFLALDLPFAFPNQQAVDEALQGDIGRTLASTLEEHGMKGVAYWTNGFKQMTDNRKPLHKPEDFAGLTFRIMPSKVLASQFARLGAKTAFIPFTEVYRNVEQNSVGGQENTISNIYSKRLYKVQSFMTLSNHGYLGYAVIFNKPFWDKLPADVRRILQEALDETSLWIGMQAREINKLQLEEIRKAGTMRIDELSEADRQSWMQILEPLYGEYDKEIGHGLVAEIRKLRERYSAP